MKKLIAIGILFIAFSTVATAQDNLANTFSTSYTKEAENNYPAAIAVLKSNYTPENYYTNLRLGWLYYYSQNYQTSIQYYEFASKIQPSSIEALLGLANATYALKKWVELNAIYKKILMIDPHNTTANYRLGLSAYYTKQFAEAEKYAANVLKLYPFDYDANLLMAGTKLSLAKIKDAKFYYNTVLLIKPNDPIAKQVLDSLK